MAISDLRASLPPSHIFSSIVAACILYNICKVGDIIVNTKTFIYINSWQYSYRLWFHPLAKYPGPFLARASSIWSTSAARKLRKAQSIQAAHERYGAIVRVAPNELSLANPAVLKDIYGHGLGLPKTDFYKAGKFTGVDSLFSMRNRHEHSGRRSILAKTFSYAGIAASSPMMSEKLLQTLNKFAEESQNGENPVELYHWVHLFALEVVCEFMRMTVSVVEWESNDLSPFHTQS
jgi:benzoate 4-monooxygenase